MKVYARMISGLVAPGARGLPMRAGGRLLYSTLSTWAISSSMTCHMRSSILLSTSSLPAGWGAAAGAGGPGDCAAAWVVEPAPGPGGCCASKLKTAAGINRNVRIGKGMLSQARGQFGGGDRLAHVT